MIPRTFPSTFAANGQQQMVVYTLPSITGLTAWIDYIPVKGVTTESATLENTYANGGYQVVDSLASLTGKQAWLDYIPVYEDASYTKPWSTDAGGYIPTSALAALLLDFTSGRLDPRVTFSRTTNATLTNSAGLVANAPMNLLTFSEQFDNAVWGKNNLAVTANSVVAPNGTTTADTITATASAASGKNIAQSTTLTGQSVFSVYAKQGTHQFIQFFANSSTFGQVNFDLLNGTLSATTATGSVTAVGNGWYRCTAVFAPSITLAYVAMVTSLAAVRAETWTSVGTESVQLWGAQLELGSTATTYNPTTVKNLLGFTENFDNAAWTKSNAFVQTNLLTYSQDFDNAAWTPAGTVTPNVTLAPDGTLTADRCAVVSGAALSQIVNSITAGINYTVSVWVKSSATGGASNVRITTNNTVAWNTGISQIYALTSDWQRITISSAIISSGTSVRLLIGAYTVGGGGDATCAGNIDVWGAQLVQGTSAGDYKATYAAAAAVGYTDIYGQPFAQKLVENTAAGAHLVQQAFSAGAAPTTATCYMKAAERSIGYLRIFDNIAGAGYATYFDLATGTVLTNASGNTATITSLGNGFWRCSVTRQITGISTSHLAQAGCTTADNTLSYTGDGTSGIYIFGAQLSDSASVDPYVYQPVAAPTSTAYYGPRFDYDPVTLAPKGLLIEEQRTNLLLRSEEFNDASWAKSGSTVTANAAVSPDGTADADKLIETASSGTHSVAQTVTVTNATVYTASMYVKAAERTFVGLYAGTPGQGTVFNLTTGAVHGPLVSSPTTSTITPAGNGWYRVSITYTSTATATAPSAYVCDAMGAFSYTGNGTSGVFIWGAQLE